MSMIAPESALLIFLVLVAAGAGVWVLYRLGFISSNRRIREKTRIEDILKQLYHVEYSGRKASLNDMAGAMKIRMRKLIPLIELMGERDLIRTTDNGIELTEDGRDYALKIVRVHRLYEKYLSERTGYNKLEWHELAEKMEHQLTVAETEKLARELGNPRFDPHGDPIPTRGGEIPDVQWVPLSAFEQGAIGKIVHIEDEPKVIYRQIINKDLHIGSQIRVLESGDRKIRFYSEGKEYEITPIVAANISMVRLSEEEIYESKSQRLSDLGQGETARILGISRDCRGASRRRLLDLGFIPGTTIRTDMVSPLKNPRAYLIRNTLIALRNDQADLVLIEKV